MSKTMTHTAAQRKDWHAGKKRSHESRWHWVDRVAMKGNFRGAYTPAWFTPTYRRIDR